MGIEPPPLSTKPENPPEPKAPAPDNSAEEFRKKLEESKVAQEKLNQKNTSSNDYVTKAEKAEQDVVKALADYKIAVEKLQLAKRDADHANECESKEATAEIGDNYGKVDTTIGAVDQPISDLRDKIKDWPKKKSDCEAAFSDAQKKLADAQAELQTGLAYQANLTAKLKAIADVEGKIQKLSDHAHPAEFYFYTKDAASLLKEVKVWTLEELKNDIDQKLAVLEQALSGAMQAKADLIEVSVDLDAAQKQLANLDKNREAQILTNIAQYDQLAAKPTETPAARAAR